MIKGTGRTWHKQPWLIISALMFFFPIGVFLTWKSNWKKLSKVLVTVVSSVAWLAIFTIAAINAPPTLNVSQLREDGVLEIRKDQLKVEGSIYPYNAVLTVNDQSVQTSSSGDYSTTVSLTEGENTVVLRVVDGEKTTEKRYLVRRLEPEPEVIKEEPAEKPATEESQEEAPEPVDNSAERNYWHEVTSVVDGDTIKARVDGRVVTIRVVGIDAPESTSSKECFGDEATGKATEFLSGKWIQLERDYSQSDRDKYDRLLRYIWFDEGTDFGRRLIEEGYAFEYTYENPYNKQAEYKNTQSYAKDKSYGLWSAEACSGQRVKPTPAPAPAPQPTTPAPSSGSSSGGSSSSSSGAVKKSRTGICHAPGTTYYNRTTNFTSYSSLQACLNSGGRLPKR